MRRPTGSVAGTEILYAGGYRFLLRGRGHECTCDLPQRKGGTDVGPTPPELFVGSLGSCIGIYLVDYCERVGLPTEGLSIQVDFDTPDDAVEITNIRVQVNLPPGIPQKRHRALRKVAEQCLVHKTLVSAPELDISFVSSESG